MYFVKRNIKSIPNPESGSGGIGNEGKKSLATD